MEITVVAKNETFNLDIVSKQEGPHTFYFGAGWDNPNGPVDLDIVCVLLSGGELTKQGHLVYFGNKTQPGVLLSEDNTTGEGEGDDESIVITTGNLPEGIDEVVIGLASYAGGDLSTAPNPHFRVCDGSEEASPEMASIPVNGAGAAGDTVLVAFKLNLVGSDWTLTNVGDFHKKGAGQASIKGFAELFKKS